MLSVHVGELAALVVLLPLVGGVIGYVVASDRLRRKTGGKTLEELHQEMADYRENVADHFQETANLLHGMTAQYRSIYKHMANGAAELCDTSTHNPQLEEMKRLGISFGEIAGTESSRGEEPSDGG